MYDLGVSQDQLDESQRGFSFMLDGPLDMRMDNESCKTAFTILNEYSEQKIAQILEAYGEERFSKKIARNIVNERRKKRIETTKDLVGIVLRSMPRSRKREKIHPATRTFQAIRIEVNGEIEKLEKSLKKAINSLKENGRVCVVSYHSLEDRVVKKIFREYSKSELKLITKKPITPDDGEIYENRRARSAKLRIAEKT